MTGDARGEAEEIVDALHDIWQRQPSEPAVTEQQVVTALAAAIDWCNVATKGDASIEEIVRVGDGIAEAVSALRARAGEETG